MTYQQVSHEIEMKLSRIKEGDCPNFYLSGSSYSALEKAALHLAEEDWEEAIDSLSGGTPSIYHCNAVFQRFGGGKVIPAPLKKQREYCKRLL